MAEKPRNPKRTANGPAKRTDRAPRKGGPGERPAHAARFAGKPGKGPARPRIDSGVDARTVEILEREGLLSAEGRKMAGDALGEGARPGGNRPRLKGGKVKFEGTRPGADPRAGRGAGKPDGAAKAGPARGGKAAARGKDAPRGKMTDAEEAVAERLQKVMAQAGVASRRHSEELIQAGRVTVNGQVVTELGTKVIPRKDRIEVDGRMLGRPENLVHILMNKPKGYVTTLYDPQGRPKVSDLLGEDVAERVYPVGRLDYETEGLLLLTNDGDLANALMHPGKMIKKTYIAKVRGVPGPAKLKALEEGIELDDGVTAPADVKLVEVKGPNAATVSMRIHEGRNRQVRRMFEAVDHEVIHLKRTTLGPLHLGEMAVGQWRELNDREVRELRLVAGVAAPRGQAGEKPAAKERNLRAGGATVARRGAGRLVQQGRPDGKAPFRGRAKGPRPFDADGEAAPAERGSRPFGDRTERGPRPFADRPARPERGDRPARPERGDWHARPERSDRPARPERGDWNARPERGGDRPARPERGDWNARPERGGDRPARPERGGDRPARPERGDWNARPERGGDRPARPERGGDRPLGAPQPAGGVARVAGGPRPAADARPARGGKPARFGKPTGGAKGGARGGAKGGAKGDGRKNRSPK